MVELRDEITDDPLGLGYAAMTDQQVLDSLNGLTRSRAVESVSSADIYDALDRAEFLALSATDREILSDIFSLSEVRVQGNTRTALLAVFGAGTTSRTNLQALTTESISRAEELGFRRLGLGLIQEARR